MKEREEIIIKHLSSFVEILAAFVIAIALLRFRYHIRNLSQPNIETIHQSIRIRFGGSLAIALELLLAADVLATAIAPAGDEIGKLAAIVTLRIALNCFLERELKTSGIHKKLKLKEK